MSVRNSVALVIGVLGGLALAGGYKRFHDVSENASAHPVATVVAPPLITTVHPVLRSFLHRVSWIGVVEPLSSVRITALMPGRIEAVEAADQARIAKGDPVARLGGMSVETQRARLAADILSLTSQNDVARQMVVRLKQNLKMRLSTNNEVAAAQEMQIRLRTQLYSARMRRKAFEDRTCMRAAVTGIFTNRRVSVGQNVTVGQVIGDIIDAGHLRIVASLFPPQGLLLPGKTADVNVGENRSLHGIVRRVLPEAGSTGATMVWIEGAEIDTQLHPGRTVTGSIVVEDGHESLAVPASAIVYDVQEHPLVFLKQGDSYRACSVRPGLTQDGWVEIFSSALNPRLSVVTQGGYELFYRHFNKQFKEQD
ncbi:MAG: efflux RND transporter periplasmic adaptor subunit [Desulfobacteraceae bacterium]|nr:efflux RND transporter periplasmic adaptor subunit [Desulfobacteraceae bacterium]